MPEDPPDDPGGGGDVYIRRLDRESFRFGGADGQRYNFLSYDRGDGRSLKILPRLLSVSPDQPELTFIIGVDLYIGDTHIYIGPDGNTFIDADGHRIRIQLKQCSLDAPGHLGNTQDEPHPLQGVPHMNVYVEKSDGPEGATGLLVDGSADSDESQYRVDG